MASLIIDDEFRRVVRRMRLAQIEDHQIAAALGFNEDVLNKWFGTLEDHKQEVEAIRAAEFHQAVADAEYEEAMARMNGEGAIYTEGDGSLCSHSCQRS